MTLQEYIKNLQRMVENYPEVKDYVVVYAEDSEGNGYDRVTYHPTIGYFEGDSFYIDKESLTEGDYIKAVCIN